MIVECANCEWEGEHTEVEVVGNEIPDLWERIEPGGIVPYGECGCGALCYLKEGEQGWPEE